MKRIGELLMVAGAVVGAAVGVAVAAHVGAPGATWFVNVALAKLGFIAAGSMMASGAVATRFAKRREAAKLLRP